MSSPPRTLTLEAQRNDPSEVPSLRQKISSYLNGPEILDDATEEQLKTQIAQSSNDERTFLTRLLHNYRRFKNRPGYRVGNRIFQSWRFEEGLATGGVQGSELPSFIVQDDSSAH